MRLGLERFKIVKILKAVLFALSIFLFSGVWAFALHILIGSTPLTPIGSLGIGILLYWFFYLRGQGEEDE